MTATLNTPAQTAELQHLAPGDLTIDENVRTRTVNITDSWIDNLREHGVKVPVLATRDPDGTIRVRDGQRRTLGALAADLPTIPVYVIGETADGDQGTIERITDQVITNDQRAGLDQAERIDALNQLSLIGVSAAQIAKRTGHRRADVDHALTVGQSAAARAALDQDQSLSLEDLALLTDFEDDPDAQDLILRARPGQRVHQHARLVAQRAEIAAHDEHAAAYVAAYADEHDGATLNVLPYNDNGYFYAGRTTPDGETVARIDRLRTDNGWGEQATLTDVSDPSRLWVSFTGEELYRHKETGALVYAEDVDSWQDPAENDGIDPDTGEAWVLNPGAVNPDDVTESTEWTVTWWVAAHEAEGLDYRQYGDRNTKQDSGETDEEKAEAKKVARRQLIAFNKASDAAQVVRREYLTKLLTRKTPPKGAAELTARVMIAGGAGSRQVSDHEVKSLAAELLGETGYGSSWADKPMTAGRAQVIALAYALAAHETGYARDSHRQESRHPALRDYLAFLASTGYTPAEVETIITDQADRATVLAALTGTPAPDAEDTEDDAIEDTEDDEEQ